MKQLVLFIALIVSFCSCSKDTQEVKTVFTKEVTFSLASSVSRATDAQFVTGDEIGVFAVERMPCIGVLKDAGNYADNKRFRFNGTTFTPVSEEDKISFSPTSTLDFYVYYPYMPHPENVTAHRFVVATDQTDGNNTSDLMLAKDISGLRNPVIPLTFHHQMALIEANFRVGEGKKVSRAQLLNRAVGATVNFQEQNYETLSSETSTIEMLKVGESEDAATFRVLLPKQVVKGGTPLFLFVVDGEEHTYQAGQDVSLIQGARSVYDVALQCLVNLSSDPEGRVNGSGIYDCGKSATVVAVPNAGYSFAGWYENNLRVSGDAIYSFVVKREYHLTARFTANAHLIMTSATNGGTAEGSGTSGTGLNFTVKATEKNGYAFTGWYENGTSVSMSMEYTFTVSGSRALEARFRPEDIYVEPRLITYVNQSLRQYGKGGIHLYYLRNGKKVSYIPEYEVDITISFAYNGIDQQAEVNRNGEIVEDLVIRAKKGVKDYHWGLIGIDEELVSRYRLVKYTRLYNIYFDRSKDSTERKYIFEDRLVGVYADKPSDGIEGRFLFDLYNEYDIWIGNR